MLLASHWPTLTRRCVHCTFSIPRLTIHSISSFRFFQYFNSNYIERSCLCVSYILFFKFILRNYGEFYYYLLHIMNYSFQTHLILYTSYVTIINIQTIFINVALNHVTFCHVFDFQYCIFIVIILII